MQLFPVFNTCVLGHIYLKPPSLPLPFFTCLPPVSFLNIFLRFSITLSPLLIPLADPQREPREWVGLKRERRAALYPARSSLARLKCSEEKKTTHGRRELFPLSPFLFPPPLYSPLSSLLSCLISHFYSPSAGARIWELWTQTRKPPELQCYTSISIPSSSLSYSFCYLFFPCLQTHYHSNVPALQSSKRGERCWNILSDTHIFTDNAQCT